MQKIEIIALLSDSKKIIERLQRRGVIEVSDIRDENLVKMNTAASISTFENMRGKVNDALNVLSEFDEQKALLPESFRSKRSFIPDDFGKKAATMDQILQTTYDILQLAEEKDEYEAKIARLRVERDALESWKSLDISPALGQTKQTRLLIGSLPRKTDRQTVEQWLPSAYVEIVSASKIQTDLLVLCLKKDYDQVLSCLRERGFLFASDLPDLPPAERQTQIDGEVSALQKNIQTTRQKLLQFADRKKDLEFAVDYLTMRADKYRALSKLGMTRQTFVLAGYIPKKYAPRLVKELEGKYKTAISLFDPDKDENVPVLLENSRFSAPVEGITEMYALPGKKDLDPTPIMSFFYYLFFGMMLSDAGYGVVMVLVTSLVLKKCKLEEKMRKTMTMFLYCGISTIFWGALFGSWFGDIVQVVGREFFGKEIGSIALWFQPLDDPMRLLLFSFGLGICHLFLGLGVNFYKLWKAGQKADAVCDVIPVMLTVLGAAPLAAGILTDVLALLSTIGKYVAIAGVALIILTAGRSSKSIFMRFFGGIYGLYNVATGYLSDILSYSRLLALGLATGSIASVINLIGTMPQNLVVKAILLVIVFIVAHSANLAINLLGAYVHTDRLQFVELFSKFYEGGGKPFEPLAVQTKYIQFKED